IVGEAVDVHGHAARCVALVGHLLVANALELTGAALDRLLDGVDRHGRGAGLVEHRPQGRVHVRVATALAGRDLDLADQLGEQLAAGLVLRTLLVLDRRPLGMTGHGYNPFMNSSWSRRSPESSGWNAAASTGPSRHRTGWSSTVARTSTLGPARSTYGARMNTAWNGPPANPATGTSASNESTWRPNALRRTVRSIT